MAETKNVTTYGRDVAAKVRKLVEELIWQKVHSNHASEDIPSCNEAERALANAVDELVRDVTPET